MKTDRLFYSATAALNLLIMFIGFREFYLSGHGHGGRVIAPRIFPVVLVHGLAVTAWYALSLGQALLITIKNRKLHMKLGWTSLALMPVIAVTGVLVAIRSVQGSPGFVFFGMKYPDFLLLMLVEIAVFTGFVLAGILTRKRPEIHRAMMLSASLSLLLGATARMPWLNALFGGDTPAGFFGPVFALGAGLLVVNSIRLRALDRWFATGYAVTAVSYGLAFSLGPTDMWRHLAGELVK